MTKIVRGRSTTISVSVPVQVGTPDIEIFDLGKTVDRAALAKGSHRLIIGRVSGGCCASLVRARIRDGQVVGIEVERCKKSMPVDRNLRRHCSRRKLSRPTRRAEPAIPVEQFWKPAVMRRMTTSL